MSLSDWIAVNGETLQIASFFGGFATLALLERLFPVRGGGARRRRWPANLGLTFRPVPRLLHATMRLGLEEVRGPETNAVGWLLASPLRGSLGPTRAIQEPLGGAVQGR